MQVPAHRLRVGPPSRARAAAWLALSRAASPRLGGQGSRKRARGCASLPRALADAQNAAAAEIVGRAFERGLSEEDVALALREREAAQAAAAAAAGTPGTAAAVGAVVSGAAAPSARGGEQPSAEDAAELTRDTIPQRGPLALPRVVAATKPRMQGVALPVPEHDPSLAAERDAADDAPAAAPGKSRAWPLAVALLLGAGALGLWWRSKATEPPQQPSQATSGVPAASGSVAVTRTTASAAAPASATATALASASAAPQVMPSASASVSTSAAVPSAKRFAKPSASTKPSAGPDVRPSATSTSSGAPSSGSGIWMMKDER